MHEDESFKLTRVDAGERLFGQRLDLRKHLGYAALEGLFNMKGNDFLVDRTVGRRNLSPKMTLSFGALSFTVFARLC